MEKELNDIFKMITSKIHHYFGEDLEKNAKEGEVDYAVPLKVYPKGYHVKKDQPLPFMRVVQSNKQVTFYHYGLYSDMVFHQIVKDKVASRLDQNVNLLKSCLHFYYIEENIKEVIEDIIQYMSVNEYINLVEKSVKKKG